MSERNWLSPKLVFGVGLCAVGVLLALDNLDLINSSQYLRWWPIVIVLFGLMRAQGIGTYRAPVGGLVVAGLGTLLLLGSVDVIDFQFWDLWPLGLIALGISLVVRTVSRAKFPARAPGDNTEPDDRTTAFAFMGGVTRRIVSERFQGGDLSAMMGGVELDLRSAKIAPGERAVIEVFVMWGGVDLRIPENWKVTSEAAVLLGGLEDKTRRYDGPVGGEIILRGLVLMGGIEVKN